MTLEEALAWLRGERSTLNWAWGNDPGEASERAARQDAALTEQAYWTVRAHREGLLTEETRTEWRVTKRGVAALTTILGFDEDDVFKQDPLGWARPSVDLATTDEFAIEEARRNLNTGMM